MRLGLGDAGIEQHVEQGVALLDFDGLLGRAILDHGFVAKGDRNQCCRRLRRGLDRGGDHVGRRIDRRLGRRRLGERDGQRWRVGEEAGSHRIGTPAKLVAGAADVEIEQGEALQLGAGGAALLVVPGRAIVRAPPQERHQHDRADGDPRLGRARPMADARARRRLEHHGATKESRGAGES